MRHVTPQPTQLSTVFGSSYVQEQHADTTTHTTLQTEPRAIGIATVWSVFFVLMIAKFAVEKAGSVSAMVLAGLQ